MCTPRNRYIFFSVCLLWSALSSLPGCAPALSKQFREQVGTPPPFKTLLQETEANKGQKVILGGYILEIANGPDGTLLTILQAPLDYQNRPKPQDLSEGRFLVETEEFLDPEIYDKNRKLTVGGKVVGTSVRALGNRSYRYPVVEAEELHLWPKEVQYIKPYHPHYYWHYPWHYYYSSYPYRWWAW